MKGLWHKGIKSRITAIFVIFLKLIFLKITVSITFKVVNRPYKNFFLVAIFLDCFFFAIICHKKVVYLLQLAPYLKICITKTKNCISLKEYFYCA